MWTSGCFLTCVVWSTCFRLCFVSPLQKASSEQVWQTRLRSNTTVPTHRGGGLSLMVHIHFRCYALSFVFINSYLSSLCVIGGVKAAQRQLLFRSVTLQFFTIAYIDFSILTVVESNYKYIYSVLYSVKVLALSINATLCFHCATFRKEILHFLLHYN